ncbi:hypothetical protein AcV7_000147 [Taiwanofungus camphoratus]|nr:hypothetical protein AcV7_000147 [Antrodia cinnamomea]
MRFHHWISVLVIVFIAGPDFVSASSSPARPLKRLTHPSTLAIEILPRRLTSSGSYDRRSFPLDTPTLRHSDTFRLKLSAFGDVFYLHLRPNEHLIHPAARVSHYRTTADGQTALTHTEPLLRESVKAYWGEVIPADASSDRLREDAVGLLTRPWGNPSLGWARIVVHHQGDSAAGIAPVFEGAFSVDGVVHHVMTKDNYLRNKHDLDPHIAVSDDNPDSNLVIWRDSDIMSTYETAAAMSGGLDTGPIPARPKTCGHDSLTFNTDPAENPVLRAPIMQPVTPWYDPLGILDDLNVGLGKRDDVAGGNMNSSFEDYIGSSVGCPSSEKIVYMGVAADCAYASHYGSKENATQQILVDWNSASALYKSTFNVSLGIIELQVQDPSCPNTADPSVPWNVDCSSNVTLNDRLSMFSGWRGSKGDDGAGLWHLMSGCPTGTEVGIAWLATLCQQKSTGSAPSIVSGTAVTTPGRTEWQVVSHEIGHNFGAIHDVSADRLKFVCILNRQYQMHQCTDGCEASSSQTQCCPLSKNSCNANSQFIMNPVTEDGEMQFSECSLGNICSLMLGNYGGMTNTSCLVNPSSSQQLITSNMCGNGVVEEGEECDPGKGSNSTCCDVNTCKFTSGAVCDPDSSPCCTAQCSFAPATQVCRPSQDPTCDTAEMCTGNSSQCPANAFAPNGKSCGTNGLACASGQCTSLDLQCQTAGTSMNLTQSCPSQDSKSCQVTCQDPTSSSQCVMLSATLIDGSPCGYGGTCVGGSCKAASPLATFAAWYRQNLQIAIPVTIIIGLVFFLLIYGLYRCKYKRLCVTLHRNLKCLYRDSEMLWQGSRW